MRFRSRSRGFSRRPRRAVRRRSFGRRRGLRIGFRM